MGLDTVELVIAFEDGFGISIANEDAEQIRTPRMVIDHIWSKLGGAEVPPGEEVCLSLRAFARVRSGIVTALDCPRGMVRPGTRLSDLFARDNRKDRWRLLPSLTGMNRFPQPGLLPALNLRFQTVGDVATDFVALQPRSLAPEGAVWSRRSVRTVV